MGEFDHSLVIWELTRMHDDVACAQCRAAARLEPRELSTAEVYSVLERIAASAGNPRLLLTGGDPLKRPDLFNIIRRSASLGLHTTVKASATPLLTHAAVARLKDSGAARLAVGLDSAVKASHDGLSGVAGSYGRTLAALRSATRVGLETQVDTTVTRHNVHGLKALGAIVARERARLWSVCFAGEDLTAEEQKHALELLHQMRAPFDVETPGCVQFHAFVSHTGEIRTGAAVTYRASHCSHLIARP